MLCVTTFCVTVHIGHYIVLCVLQHGLTYIYVVFYQVICTWENVQSQLHDMENVSNTNTFCFRHKLLRAARTLQVGACLRHTVLPWCHGCVAACVALTDVVTKAVYGVILHVHQKKLCCFSKNVCASPDLEFSKLIGEPTMWACAVRKCLHCLIFKLLL